jgi:hypothetical protein
VPTANRKDLSCRATDFGCWGGVAVAAAAIVASAGAASAHVSVNPDTATPIKTDDGEVTEAVSAITWTAASPASAIKPGQFDEFDVSAGPLPEATSMQFKALQTYSDGEVVRWIEPAPANGSEPEHPAPTLKLTPALAEGASTAPTATTSKSSPTKGSDSSHVSQASVNTALGLSVAALIGLVAGRWAPSHCAAGARRCSRSTWSSPGSDRRSPPNGGPEVPVTGQSVAAARPVAGSGRTV